MAHSTRHGLTFWSVLVSASLGAVVVGVFVLTGFTVQEFRSAQDAAVRTEHTLVTAGALERSVLDMQTGLRGYALTGQPRFLLPYQFGLRTYPPLARALISLTGAEPAQHRRAVSISAAIAAYLRGWAQPQLRKIRDGQLAAVRRATASGRGEALISALRAQFAAFTAAEQRLSESRTANAGDLGALSVALSITGAAVSALALLGLGLAVNRRIALPLRRLSAGMAQVSAGELAVRVPCGGLAEVGEVANGFNAMAGSLERTHADLRSQQAELETQQSALQRALDSVEERRARAETLQRFGDRLSAASGVEEVSAVALQTLADAVSAEIGVLYLLEEDTGGYHRAAGRPDSVAPAVITAGETLAGRALAEHRLVLASHHQAPLRLAGLTGELHAVHEAHLPLIYGGQSVGVLSLARVDDTPFTGSDFALLADLAQQTTAASVQALATRQVERVARRLDAVLSTTDEGVLAVDSAGRIVLANRAALELVGYQEGELIGLPMHATLHHSRADGAPYPAEECPMTAARVEGVSSRGADEVFWRRDGSPIPVEYSVFPLREDGRITGAVITFADVTDRKRAEQQREVQHAVARALAEAASLPGAWQAAVSAVCHGLAMAMTWGWEPSEDRESLTCQAFCARTGFGELAGRIGGQAVAVGEGLAGLAFAERAPAISADLAHQPLRPGAATDPRLRSGVAIPVLDSAGEVIAVTELAADRDLRAEDGLIETLTTIAAVFGQFLERARAREEAERARDEFVTNVAHELRSPLSAIHGWLQVLSSGQAGPLTDDQQRSLETIGRNANRLLRMTEDLMTARQLAAGGLSLSYSDVNIAEVAREGVESVTAQAKAKRLAVSLETTGPQVIRGDRTRLTQLLANLLTNAVKFTPKDGQVRVSVAVGSRRCQIRVADTGIGIPAEERPRLFQRFYRASSASAHGISGTGLGLAICKAITDAHHGVIYLADRAGPGTEFVVELPVTPGDGQPAQESSQATEE